MQDRANRYTFGDSDEASDRLAIVAELFAPTTDELLARWAPERPALALDLGCGPGFTAEAVRRACDPGRLVAVDASVAMARRAHDRLAAGGGPTRALALVADVTAPLPTRAADLVHARYLLAHLPEPRAVVDRWCAQLAPGGRLLLDEIERIDTDIEPFARYLATATTMIAAQGAAMSAGPVLAGHAPTGIDVLTDEVITIPQPVATVARMFGLNLSVWRHHDWARANLDPTALDALAAELEALRHRGRRAGEVTWYHRRLVLAAPA